MRYRLAALIFLGAIAVPFCAQAANGVTGNGLGANGKLINGGRPLKHVAFPPIRDWSSLRITLHRSGCFGRCPAYGVEIHGDGTVIYKGERFVAVTGEQTAKIPESKVRALFALFRKGNYFWLHDRYAARVTDLPTFVTSISYDGHSKQVGDYAGHWIGMPDIVNQIELAIDDAADTEQWTKGAAH